MEIIKSNLTKAKNLQLHEKGTNESVDKDHPPSIKWVLTDTFCVLVIIGIAADYPDIAFSMCDLGVGFSETDAVNLSEIGKDQCEFFPLYRDPAFKAAYPLSVYASTAWQGEAIADDEASVQDLI